MRHSAKMLQFWHTLREKERIHLGEPWPPKIAFRSLWGFDTPRPVSRIDVGNLPTENLLSPAPMDTGEVFQLHTPKEGIENLAAEKSNVHGAVWKRSGTLIGSFDNNPNLREQTLLSEEILPKSGLKKPSVAHKSTSELSPITRYLLGNRSRGWNHYL